ncbi:hypothetical protein B296_00026264 [Ensete ventricosum]|uniref:Uncharacterized protein n=1 Tax=Ensete ventricosum TaxID=4639 RepID=A0A426ZCY4_ENSVE|nr:hypothetical protein B296_00026264 [Ensete ventricosum]
MGRTSGSDVGGWLLEWWSSSRVEVSKLGLAVVSYKKVRSVPGVTLPMVKLVLWLILRSPAQWRRRGIYSDSNGISVPESLIFFIAYHTTASHHAVCGPCGEARTCR